MDAKLENGDLVLNSTGDHIMIDGVEEAIQRVRTVLLTQRGSFVYDRTLGVEYEAFGEEAYPTAKLDMLFKEAVADLGGVEAEVLSFDASSSIVSIRVKDNGRSAVTEVDISGYI